VQTCTRLVPREIKLYHKLMNRLILLVAMSFMLYGCATTSTQVEGGSVKSGMNKDDFCQAVYTFNPKKWPCSSGSYFSSKAAGLYYPETKMEIMHDSFKKYFFVFEEVNTPFNYTTWDVGDGRLVKIFKNYDNAKNFASATDFEIEEDVATIAKNGCKSSGLKEGTIEFADCSLNAIIELSK